MAKDVRFGTFTNRHNFKFNEDQVSALYLGDNRVWVNEVTITFLFIDSTGSNVNFNGNLTQTVVGVPGTTFSSFSRTVTRVDDSGGGEGPSTKLNGATCTETGDVDNVITCAVTGSGNVSRTITVSGTIPSNASTIMLDISADTTTLLSRNCSASPLSIVSPTGDTPIFTVGPQFSGGGNYSAVAFGTTDDAADRNVITYTFNGGITSGASGVVFGGNGDSGAGSYESFTVGYNVGENDSYRSCQFRYTQP